MVVRNLEARSKLRNGIKDTELPDQLLLDEVTATLSNWKIVATKYPKTDNAPYSSGEKHEKKKLFLTLITMALVLKNHLKKSVPIGAQLE